MNDLDRDLAGAARAHDVLIAALQALTDDEVTHPSLLPGWTVGHVTSHIARNADGQARMLDAATGGEVGHMYPGGRDQRTHDIEAGSRRSAAAIVDDVATSAARLEAIWAAMPKQAWSGRGISIAGEMTMRDLPFIRWREVTVHHADLGIGYSWADWDDDYVRLELARLTMLWASRKPMGLTDLPAQAKSVAPRHRVAWLLGREPIDGLSPAGIMG